MAAAQVGAEALLDSPSPVLIPDKPVGSEGSDADSAPRAVPRLLRLPAATALSVVVAAITLIPFRTPTFDVWAWLLWGREAAHGDLSTTWGPAFKPLPVAVATVLSPLGDAVPVLWLLLARVGGLLALVAAARLAHRRAGWLGAGLAALGLAMVRQYTDYLAPQGMSEPMTVAFLLWAIDRHLAGRRETAFWLGVLAGLLRPEVWPFLLGYLLLLLRQRARTPDAGSPERPTSDPTRPKLWRRLRGSTRLVIGLVLLPVAWYLPDYLGSGEAFRQGEGVPVPGGPLTQAHPGLAVARQISADVPLWVLIGAGLALLVALRRRDRTLLALTGLGLGWLFIVAAMAETGRATGVSRYDLPPYALAAVLGGIGWAHAVRLLVPSGTAASRRPARAPGAVAPLSRSLGVAACLIGLVLLGTSLSAWSGQLRDGARELRYQRGLAAALPRALQAAGGGPAVARCGQLWTSMYQVTFVAWTLHEHIVDVWSLQAPGLPEPAYVGPLLQTRDRRDAPLAPQPFSFLAYRYGGSATADGATWTILLPADCG